MAPEQSSSLSEITTDVTFFLQPTEQKTEFFTQDQQ